jgi:hypothetical protein
MHCGPAVGMVSELHSCFGDDGLLWYVIKEGSDATIEDCYTSWDASSKLGGERKLPICVNFGGLRSATLEDRNSPTSFSWSSVISVATSWNLFHNNLLSCPRYISLLRCKSNHGCSSPIRTLNGQSLQEIHP